MDILIGCEEFGRVREAFRNQGHNAFSCDLFPAADESAYHFQCDIKTVLYNGWDAVIAFPPCTYLSNVRNAAYYNEEARQRDRRLRCEAIEFVDMIWQSNDVVAIENPVGALSTQWRKPTQIIHPYWFGETWHKTTCLWLKGLPKLAPTKWVGSKGSWHYHSRNSRKSSLTFQGIADAMAQQWMNQKSV
jgi:site-specific DNA-cytosine methylase